MKTLFVFLLCAYCATIYSQNKGVFSPARVKNFGNTFLSETVEVLAEFNLTSNLSELQAEINSLVEQFIVQHGFSGSVLVIQNGNPIFAAGYGEATQCIPNEPGTTFRWDSITKIATTVAILQLYQEGVLDLDTPITTYLPEYSNPLAFPGFAGLPTVTIRTLDAMTTGIADLPPTNWLATPPTITDIATFVGQLPRTSPGIWAYSNPSSSTLALIIGRLLDPTGDPSTVFGQYLVDHIFIPAGMKTASAPSIVSEDNPDAQSHIYNSNGQLEEIGTNQYPEYTSMRVGSGNINGSIKDFQHFITALNNGQLITMDNLSMMLGQRLGGWDPGSAFINGEPLLAKGGAQLGEQSYYMRFANNTTIFIVANVDPRNFTNPFDHIQFLGSEIAKLLFPEP